VSGGGLHQNGGRDGKLCQPPDSAGSDPRSAQQPWRLPGLPGGEPGIGKTSVAHGRSGVGGEAAQDSVEDRGALLAGRGRVLGPGHVERALVKRADEDVGQRHDLEIDVPCQDSIIALCAVPESRWTLTCGSTLGARTRITGHGGSFRHGPLTARRV